MQRLIGDAQQGTVGNAEAITLRGNGRAFHIDSHRAAEVKAQRRGRVAQFPVTIVGGNHRSGTQPLFNLFAGHSANLLGGVVKRALNFGDARNRDIRR